jgi:hypothetical protein
MALPFWGSSAVQARRSRRRHHFYFTFVPLLLQFVVVTSWVISPTKKTPIRCIIHHLGGKLLIIVWVIFSL